MKSMITDPQRHHSVRLAWHTALSLGAMTALLATGLMIETSARAEAAPLAPSSAAMTKVNYSAPGAPTSATLLRGTVSTSSVTAPSVHAVRSPLVAPIPQAALVLTSTSGTAGTALTLTSSGGSGTGAVTYGVTSIGTADCAIVGATLNATSAGTCTVTVTKAADATYMAASSPATTVTFAPAAPKSQAALVLTSTTGTAGTALTLTSSGGSGTGAVTYGVTSTGTAGCWITGSKLNATKAGTCTVTVTKAADATYMAASSPATTVTFAPALRTQAALSLTSRSGTFGTELTLTSSGGSGTGAVTYAVTSSGTAGCWITSGRLNATRAGTCTVTVTKAGDATYLIARSAPTTVTFRVGLTASRVDGIVWTGRTSIVSVIGTGFYNKPTIKSNEPRTRAVVLHDYGNRLVVRVTLPAGSPLGWHTFVIILSNGRACQVKYLVKVGLTASRVDGIVWTGRTSVVSVIGTGFYNRPTVTSNEPRTNAAVIHDYGNRLVVRVTLPAGSPQGWHTFTIIDANGQSCRVKYMVK